MQYMPYQQQADPNFYIAQALQNLLGGLQQQGAATQLSQMGRGLGLNLPANLLPSNAELARSLILKRFMSPYQQAQMQRWGQLQTPFDLSQLPEDWLPKSGRLGPSGLSMSFGPPETPEAEKPPKTYTPKELNDELWKRSKTVTREGVVYDVPLNDNDVIALKQMAKYSDPPHEFYAWRSKDEKGKLKWNGYFRPKRKVAPKTQPIAQRFQIPKTFEKTPDWWAKPQEKKAYETLQRILPQMPPDLIRKINMAIDRGATFTQILNFDEVRAYWEGR